MIDYLAAPGCHERQCKASFRVSQNTSSAITKVVVQHHDHIFGGDRYWLVFDMHNTSLKVADIRERIIDWINALHTCPPRPPKPEEPVWD